MDRQILTKILRKILQNCHICQIQIDVEKLDSHRRKLPQHKVDRYEDHTGDKVHKGIHRTLHSGFENQIKHEMDFCPPNYFLKKTLTDLAITSYLVFFFYPKFVTVTDKFGGTVNAIQSSN